MWAFDEGLREALAAFGTVGRTRQCLLLVDHDFGRLDQLAHELRDAHGWKSFSVGRALAEALRDVAPGLRGRTADRWLRDRIAGWAPGPVLLSEIDLLFEPRLDLDPLALFVQASRLTSLVVTWPGSYDGKVLAYATPEHGHYRTWVRPEVMAVALSFCSPPHPGRAE